MKEPDEDMMQTLCDDVQDLVKAVETGADGIGKILRHIADSEQREIQAPVVNVTTPPAIVNMEARPTVTVTDAPRSFRITFKRDNYGNITSADVDQK